MNCPKCNTPLTKCLVSGGITKLIVTKLPEKLFINKESSSISPFVCPNCGYIEWYADSPTKLK